MNMGKKNILFIVKYVQTVQYKLKINFFKIIMNPNKK